MAFDLSNFDFWYAIAFFLVILLFYFFRYKTVENGIFRAFGLVSKFAIAFFIILDMLLPQLGISLNFYPDPTTIIYTLIILFFGDFFKSNKNGENITETTKKPKAKIKR